jgi:hypothetical protein
LWQRMLYHFPSLAPQLHDRPWLQSPVQSLLGNLCRIVMAIAATSSIISTVIILQLRNVL